jgi:CubicO group peptidase (beta-lactamase class C family)
MIQGIATGTELQTAWGPGVRVVKFFPAASLGGPAAVRALASIIPEMRFVPTGGIGKGDLRDYLAVLNTHPQAFPPDEPFSYNTGGYVDLAQVAERVGGTPFHDAARAPGTAPAPLPAPEDQRIDDAAHRLGHARPVGCGEP